MKKKITTLSIMFILFATMFSVMGCKNQDLKGLHNFEAPVKIQVSLSAYCDIPTMREVFDDVGAIYFPMIVVYDVNNAVVEFHNNKFLCNDINGYRIVYSIEYKSETVIKETAVEVVDKMGPSISLSGYKKTVLIDDVVAIPTPELFDNSGKPCSIVSTKVRQNGAEVAIATNESQKTFVAKTKGVYTIEITAQDNIGNVSVENFDILCKKINEIETFDIVETINDVFVSINTYLTLNTENKYCYPISDNIASLHLTTNVNQAYPELKLFSFDAKGINSYNYIVGRVYNNGPVDVTVQVASNYRMALKSKAWNNIVIAKANNEVSFNEIQSTGNLRLVFVKDDGGESTFDLFIDDFAAYKNYFDVNFGLTYKDTPYVAPKPTLPDGAKLKITITSVDGELVALDSDNSFIPTKAKYLANYQITISGEFIEETYFLDVYPKVIRSEKEVESFNNVSALAHIAVSGATASLSSEKSIFDGSQALKLVVTKESADVKVILKNIGIKNIAAYDYIEYKIFVQTPAPTFNETRFNYGSNMRINAGLNTYRLYSADYVKAFTDCDGTSTENITNSALYFTFIGHDSNVVVYIDDIVVGNFDDQARCENALVDFNYYQDAQKVVASPEGQKMNFKWSVLPVSAGIGYGVKATSVEGGPGALLEVDKTNINKYDYIDVNFYVTNLSQTASSSKEVMLWTNSNGAQCRQTMVEGLNTIKIPKEKFSIIFYNYNNKDNLCWHTNLSGQSGDFECYFLNVVGGVIK